MPAPAPSPLDLDILRASLGPSLLPPYEHGLGPAPWLTAGTLTWPAGESGLIMRMWAAWAPQLPPSALTAVRRTRHVVAIDVALIGDPWGAAARLHPLRALHPASDTVGLAAPSALRDVPAPVAVAAAPKGTLPDMRALAAAPVPEGIAIGARHDAAAGPALIALGIAAEVDRLHLALAGLDRALRARVVLD